MKRFLLSFFFLLLISGVSAIPYTPLETIDSLDWSTNGLYTNEDQQFVYNVSIRPYSIAEVTLTASETMVPVIDIYDVEREEIIVHKQGDLGGEARAYIAGALDEEGITKEYYIIVSSTFMRGNRFTLQYVEERQNDAELGIDATKRFQEALVVGEGEHTGQLGGIDSVDYYALLLKTGDDMRISVYPTEGDILEFTLIDSDLFTTRRIQGTEEIIGKYTALKEEKIWIGISGSGPYSFTVENLNATIEEVTPVVEDVVEEVKEEDFTAVVPTEPVVENESDSPLLLYIIVGLVVLLLVFGVFFFRYNKKVMAKLKDQEKNDEKKKKRV